MGIKDKKIVYYGGPQKNLIFSVIYIWGGGLSKEGRIEHFADLRGGLAKK